MHQTLPEGPESREHKTGSCPQKNPRPVIEMGYSQVNMPWDLCWIRELRYVEREQSR